MCLSLIFGSLHSDDYFLYETQKNEDISSIAKKFEVEPIDIISINPEVLSSTQTFKESKKLIIWKKDELFACPEFGEVLELISFNLDQELITNQLINECFSKLNKRIDPDLLDDLSIEEFDFDKFLANERNIDYLFYDLATQGCNLLLNKSACGLNDWKFKEIYFELYKRGVLEIAANEEYFDLYDDIGKNLWEDDYEGLIDQYTNELFNKIIKAYYGANGFSNYSFITESDEIFLASKEGILEVLNMPHILRGFLISAILEWSTTTLTNNLHDPSMTYIGEMELKQRNNQGFVSQLICM